MGATIGLIKPLITQGGGKELPAKACHPID